MMFYLLAVNKQDILSSLGVLWKGMLAIAIVIAGIIAITALMNAIDRRIREKKEKKEQLPDAEQPSSEQGKS